MRRSASSRRRRGAHDTGFAVALNVLPAPSFSSRYCFAFSNVGRKPSHIDPSLMFGSVSIVDSSKTDCALSVTGHRVDRDRHRPMPRNPNATRPKRRWLERPSCPGNWLPSRHRRPSARRWRIHPVCAEVSRDQAGEELSEGPPSREAVTISRTWRTPSSEDLTIPE